MPAPSWPGWSMLCDQSLHDGLASTILYHQSADSFRLRKGRSTSIAALAVQKNVPVLDRVGPLLAPRTGQLPLCTGRICARERRLRICFYVEARQSKTLSHLFALAVLITFFLSRGNRAIYICGRSGKICLVCQLGAMLTSHF